MKQGLLIIINIFLLILFILFIINKSCELMIKKFKFNKNSYSKIKNIHLKFNSLIIAFNLFFLLINNDSFSSKFMTFVVVFDIFAATTFGVLARLQILLKRLFEIDSF